MSEHPPEPILFRHVPKGVLVWAQIVRTACSVLAVTLNATVLVIVLTR